MTLCQTRQLIGVDPGMVSGAAVKAGDHFSFWMHSDNPLDIWALIFLTASRHPNTKVVLEDMLGGGPRPKEIQHTIELVGFFYWTCKAHKIAVVKRWPQARLSCVHLVPPEIKQKDEISAAAHVISYEETPHD